MQSGSKTRCERRFASDVRVVVVEALAGAKLPAVHSRQGHQIFVRHPRPRVGQHRHGVDEVADAARVIEELCDGGVVVDGGYVPHVFGDRVVERDRPVACEKQHTRGREHLRLAGDGEELRPSERCRAFCVDRTHGNPYRLVQCGNGEARGDGVDAAAKEPPRG
jgi:hypothetical protein